MDSKLYELIKICDDNQLGWHIDYVRQVINIKAKLNSNTNSFKTIIEQKFNNYEHGFSSAVSELIDKIKTHLKAGV